MNADQVLKLVRLTEKANKLSSIYGQYTFEVNPASTKHTVRDAVEKTFKVTVTRVNIINVAGKPKRSRQGRPIVTAGCKKAIVTLKSGDKIELT
jgi:large subunit ribosomal protein L23